MTNLSLLLQVGWFLARENKKQVVGAKMFVPDYMPQTMTLLKTRIWLQLQRC
jgi:hypothetical protein